MKIIDLYNLITNKEYDKLPNKIMLKDYDYIFTLREDCTGYKWYGEVNTHCYFEETIHQNLEFILNCEITILDKIEEEKKIPEKIRHDACWIYDDETNQSEKITLKDDLILNKLDDIIDYLDYFKSKGE